MHSMPVISLQKTPQYTTQWKYTGLRALCGGLGGQGDARSTEAVLDRKLHKKKAPGIIPAAALVNIAASRLKLRGPTPEWVGWTVSPAVGHLPWPGVLLVGELAQVPHYPER